MLSLDFGGDLWKQRREDAYVARWETFYGFRTFYGFEDEEKRVNEECLRGDILWFSRRKRKNEKMRDAYVCETFYGFEDEKMRNAYVAIDILCKTENICLKKKAT